MKAKVSTSCQFVERELDVTLGNPQKTASAGIAHLVEHLICNQATSAQFQTLKCQPKCQNGAARGGFWRVLSTVPPFSP
jgi:hypothetical protein